MKKIKKALTLFLSLCIMLSAFAFTVNAETRTGTCGENLTWTLDDEGTLTISGEGDMTNYEDYLYSPLAVSKYIKNIVIQNGVTSIGDYAFSYCSELVSVIIPESVTYIGIDAFYYCTSLESINIPDSVTTIEAGAFFFCRAIESINIPDSVTFINPHAFGAMYALTEITVSENNTAYSSENGILFSKDKKTIVCYPAGKTESTYIIPDSVVTIGDVAINCRSLKSVTIPNTVTYIGAEAFFGCDNLESVTIPDSVVTVSRAAFSDCYSLSSVTIGKSVTTIGYNAFNGCEALKSVVIPDSVTSIESGTFTSCDSLESVIIGNSVTKIGSGAFSHCKSLKSINIPDSVTIIEGLAFYTCPALSSVTIPDSVTIIEGSAFGECPSLLSVTIPDSVVTIEFRAFGFYLSRPIEGFSITGVKGSAAETYAIENGLEFVALDLTKLPENDFYIDEETKTMPNIVEGMTASEIVSTLDKCGITATMTDKNGNDIADDTVVGTGAVVKTSDGKELVVIVKGDIDGSGDINITDYLMIKRCMYGYLELQGEYRMASDIDRNGSIDTTDYIKIKSYLLNLIDLFK